MSPPTMQRPRPMRLWAVAPPMPRAMGRAPMMAAKVVMRMGRNRMRQASRIASSGFLFSSLTAALAKSTIMIPFFKTMPMSKMSPTKE